MVFPRMLFLILILFLRLQTTSASSWQTLNGKAPIVIARGGYSGVFPDSSDNAYNFVSLIVSPDTTLWCDLQLTKDGVGFCFPNLNLNNGSDVANIISNNNNEWFPGDFTWKNLSAVNLVQDILSRPPYFDGIYSILTIEEVAKMGTSGLWLNIQHNALYAQHNLSMKESVVSLSRRLKFNFISSPEISFLQSMKNSVNPSVTKLIFRFLNHNQIDPSTNQSYGSLAKNLSYIKTFSSGILVPKSYVWPVRFDLYLQPHTSLVTDAHRVGLQVFASEFANDFLIAYNYSYDSTAEYLSFIDNGNFSVDGFLSDFPLTPHQAIKCFSHLDNKNAKEQAKMTIISENGASGDFPGCTDLAYQKAVSDGVDILDCNVQMSKDKIPFCLSSIDLMNSTNVFGTSFKNLSLAASEIQQRDGIYTFSLTMSQIRTLKPAISSPEKNSALFRNPRNNHIGKFLTLSEFLFLPNRYSSPLGVLIKVENAAYLMEHQGISVVDAVLDELKKATTLENQTSATTIMIQSTDKSVLMKFKEKRKMNHNELVYRVDEDIRDVEDSAIKDIKNFAGSIVISKRSVCPVNHGFVKFETEVVTRLKSNGLQVYLERFSNEFVTQVYDFLADPTVEIDAIVRNIDITGIITDFPATAARYRKNQCYTSKDPIRPGELITVVDTRVLSPADAPFPLLKDIDVMETPLPEARSQPPPAPKAEAKAKQVSSVVITLVMLLYFSLV